ncbi:MAG: YkoP family protein [Candidatus Dormibacterales bacterium]
MILRLGRAGAGRATGPLAVWAGWERLMLRRHPLREARPGGLLLFRVEHQRGADHRLKDGSLVRHGDPIVELHLANRRLLAMRTEPGYSTWRVMRTLRSDLVALGQRIAAGELGPVAALHGVSLIGAGGGLAGFEVGELPHTWRTALERYFLAGLDAVYHPAGLDRLRGRARERWPAEVWMSSSHAAALGNRR